MTLTLRIGLSVLLCWAMFSIAQDKTGPIEQKVSPPATSSSVVKPAQSHRISRGPIDVLTDTRGVDFIPYLKQLLENVRDHWYRAIPDSARGPIMKKGTVLVGFRIMKNGALDDLHYVESDPGRTKQSSTDREVLPCVTTSIRLMEGVEIVVSPSPAQVTRGASQQFSATIEGASNSVVNWSVRGQGCAGSDCGIISATGLYTAPTRLPDPPRVTVTAVLADNPDKSDSAAVIIVQPGPSH